jgi:hypothetical protein
MNNEEIFALLQGYVDQPIERVCLCSDENDRFIRA